MRYPPPSIACVVLVHAFPDVVRDTVESIFCNVTDKVIVLVDGAHWENFRNVDLGPAKVIKGFCHGARRGPYRNSVLGVKLLHKYFPDVDWYCYTEYDTVFVNGTFRKNLEACKAWVVGSQMQIKEYKNPFLDEIIQHEKRISKQYKFIAACMFLNKDFIRKITENGFIDRFLEKTKHLKGGRFPQKKTFTFEELLWPTLAVYSGGKLREVSYFHKKIFGGYRGDPNWAISFRNMSFNFYKRIMPSIIHPLKKFDNRTRTVIRERRHRKFGKYLKELGFDTEMH